MFAGVRISLRARSGNDRLDTEKEPRDARNLPGGASAPLVTEEVNRAESCASCSGVAWKADVPGALWDLFTM